MPHANKASAPVGVDIPEFEGRYVDLGGYTVGFETYQAGAPYRAYQVPDVQFCATTVLASLARTLPALGCWMWS